MSVVDSIRNVLVPVRREGWPEKQGEGKQEGGAPVHRGGLREIDGRLKSPPAWILFLSHSGR